MKRELDTVDLLPSDRAPRPVAAIVASVMDLANGRFPGQVTSAKNVDALIRFSGCLPIIVPSVGENLDTRAFLEHIDGLVLTGGRANIEPHHYDGPPFPPDEARDPFRDHTALSLVRACVAEKIPVFGICRGIQELNVALGGSLHYRLHLVDGLEDHRMPQTENPSAEEVFRLRHTLHFPPGSTLGSLAGGEPVKVNSLHGQGIDRLAEALRAEAIAEDGVIEAVRLRNDPTFTVGVQWHAEWRPENHPFSRRLFEEFGAAATARAAHRRRLTRPAPVVAAPPRARLERSIIHPSRGV